MDEREDQLDSLNHPLLPTTTAVQAEINESLEQVRAVGLQEWTIPFLILPGHICEHKAGTVHNCTGQQA